MSAAISYINVEDAGYDVRDAAERIAWSIVGSHTLNIARITPERYRRIKMQACRISVEGQLGFGIVDASFARDRHVAVLYDLLKDYKPIDDEQRKKMLTLLKAKQKAGFESLIFEVAEIHRFCAADFISPDQSLAISRAYDVLVQKAGHILDEPERYMETLRKVEDFYERFLVMEDIRGERLHPRNRKGMQKTISLYESIPDLDAYEREFELLGTYKRADSSDAFVAVRNAIKNSSDGEVEKKLGRDYWGFWNFFENILHYLRPLPVLLSPKLSKEFERAAAALAKGS